MAFVFLELEGMGSEICLGGNSNNCRTWMWGIVKFVWGIFSIHIVAKLFLKGFLFLFELLGKGKGWGFPSYLTNGKCWNLMGFMGDSNGRIMVFCYWWNERRKPYCKKLKINVGSTLLLWNNSNRSWQFMKINSKCVDRKCVLDICYRIVISISTSILCSLYIKWKFKSIIKFQGK